MASPSAAAATARISGRSLATTTYTSTLDGQQQSGSSPIPMSGSSSAIPSFLWIDFHIHKNGGTSIRDVMRRMRKPPDDEAPLLDQLHEFRTAPKLNLAHILNEMKCKQRTAVELHEHRWTIQRWLPQIAKLRVQYRNCTRILLSTRVREPLAYYISMYNWAKIKTRFKFSFDGWAAPNMQTLQTSLGDFRSFAEGNLWSGKHRYALANGTDYAAASAMLRRNFDLVYTTERFNDAMPYLLSCLLQGAPPRWFFNVSSSHFHASPAWGRAHTGPKTNASIKWHLDNACPNMTHCEELVRSIAPWDYRLYHLGKRLEGLHGVGEPPADRGKGHELPGGDGQRHHRHDRKLWGAATATCSSRGLLA